MFEVDVLSAFNDNYIWLIKNLSTKQVAVIDPGDASVILNWLTQNNDWQLTNILITHHHHDHTDGVNQLKSKTMAQVIGPHNSIIPDIDYSVTDNQTINIIGTTAKIIAVPGHTLDHIVYYFSQDGWLFSGDTLFAGGCGRVFEGTMEQMYHSLERLSQLPNNTLIYAAHEYTINNLNFALTVDPTNIKIKQVLDRSIELVKQQKITLPSTLIIEKLTNPFLRCNNPNIITAAEQYRGHPLDSTIEVFTALRDWKNNY